ncbi:hypothetical protein ACSSS7_006771 [Eimeria intestinalis]
MSFPDCGDLCSVPRRHIKKQFSPAPPSGLMQPTVYGEMPLSAPPAAATVHRYVTYPLKTQKGPAGSVPIYGSPYFSSPYAGVPATERTPEPGMGGWLTSGSGLAELSSSNPPAGPTTTYYYPTTSTAGGLGAPRTAVSPAFPQPLRVPEAGTQKPQHHQGRLALTRQRDDGVYVQRPRMSSASPYSRGPQPHGGGGGGPPVGPQLNSKAEEEAQQEVRHLHLILNAREAELEEKEIELQDAKRELKSLMEHRAPPALPASERADDKQGEPAEGGVSRGPQQEDEVSTLRKRVDLLRHERRDLLELLLQKEKQVAVLDTVDPQAKEASAVQLGAQAISIVQGASEWREKLQLAEAQLTALKAERAAAAELQQETFEKLTDKRKEAAELLELVAQRDMRIARMEAVLNQKTKEFEVALKRLKERLSRETKKREEAEQECLVALEQCNAFKATLASRDSKILMLESEVVRKDTLLRQLEEKVHVLSSDLNSTHAQLQQLLAATAAKDAYMQELEAQLRKNDVERQTAYLTEVSKSRKLALETRMQQEQCRQALNEKQEKLAAAKLDLLRSQSAMRNIRKAILQSSSLEGRDSIAAARSSLCLEAADDYEASSPSHTHKTIVPLPPPSEAPADIPHVPVAQSLRSLGADFLLQQQEQQQQQPLLLKSVSSEAAMPSAGAAASKRSQDPQQQQQGGGDSSSISVSSGPSGSFGGPVGLPPVPPRYVPARGDPLDEAVARLLHKPQYRGVAGNVCRLEPGSYLCCMQELQMELEPDGQSVTVKGLGSSKVDLASYLDLLVKSGDSRGDKAAAGKQTPHAAGAAKAATPARPHSEQSPPKRTGKH